MKRLYLGVLILIITVLYSTVYAQPKYPGVIGALIPLGTVEGIDMRNGIELAAEEVNAVGGVLGRPLMIIWEDTGSAITRPSSAKKLVEVDKVPLILGAYPSGVSPATEAYLNKQGVVQIPIGPSSPVFNLMDLAEIIGTDLGKFALEDSGAKRVGFFTVGNAIGMEIEKWAKKFVKQAGGKIVSEIRFRASGKDYRAEIGKLFRHRPEIVFFTPVGKEARFILQQASELGFKEKIGWYSPYVDLWAIYVIPETAEGIKGLNIGVRKQLYTDYFNKYEKKFMREPKTIMSPYAYDATWMAALAMNRAKSTRRSDLVSALFQIAPTYMAVTGGKAFDKGGGKVPKKYETIIYKRGNLVSYSPCPLPPFCRKQIQY